MPVPELSNPPQSERLQALRKLALLDSPCDSSLDRLARLAARILKAPIAFVSVIDGDNLLLKSHVGLPDDMSAARVVPLSQTFCERAVSNQQPLVIADARLHPVGRDNPLVHTYGFTAYIGIPLLTLDGGVLGTFCVIDTQPRAWTADDVNTMTDLAASVMTELELRLELSERGAAEERAKRAMLWSRSLVDSLQSAILLEDENRHILLVNQEFCQLFELSETPATLVGRNISGQAEVRKYLFKDSEGFTRRINGIIEKKAHVTGLEVEMVDGRVLAIDYVPVFINSAYRGHLWRFEDVTERRRMIAALEEKEQFIERVVTTSPDVIYVYDLVTQGNLYSSRHTGEVLGYSADEIRAMGSDVFAQLMHPADISRLGPYFAGFTGAEAGAIRENEYRMRHRNGEWRWMWSRDTVVHRDENGMPTQIIGVAKDITKRRFAEQALENSLNELTILRRVEAEMNETLNLDTVLMIAMDAAMRATSADSGVIGLLEGDQLRVMHSIDSFPAGTLVHIDAGITGRVLRTHKPELVLDVSTDPDYIALNPTTSAQMTIPLLYRDRMIGVLNLETSNPEKFHEAAFDFLKLLATRITIAIDNAQLYQVSQSQLEELAQLYVRVSDLEQSKTNMIRVAAHDLRNPVGLVLGYTDLLLEERDSLSEHQREYLDSIHRAGNKMLKLINDILSLERITAGSPEQHQTISLCALAQEVFSANADNARQKSQRYTIVCDDDPLMVRGDTTTLREAMNNFIHNALKYTPPGNAITVRLEQRGAQAAFEVEDTGYGIPDDQQDRLFQPFYRARTTETYQIEGTGLGLNLVKIIIEKHGGKVYFNSTYGKGSLFGFELKIVADDLT